MTFVPWVLTTIVALGVIVCANPAAAEQRTGQKPIILDATYKHDPFGTQPVDIFREYGAFVVSFDSKDDDTGDGAQDIRGIPEWVAYELKRVQADCIRIGSRPKPWFTDGILATAGIAPRDNSYAYPNDLRQPHQQWWYDRGHLATNLLSSRHPEYGLDWAWNTDTILNAVPQRGTFDRQIWKDLEELTGAWAEVFGRVWIITGPVIPKSRASGRIGEQDKAEFLVAVPDALFKIVARLDLEPGEAVSTAIEAGKLPRVLAFIYPQVGPGYTFKDLTIQGHNRKYFDHTRFLTTIDEIEEMTGLDFFTVYPKEKQRAFEGTSARQRPAPPLFGLWPWNEELLKPACKED